jgi:DNA-binding CsgD family transcriptional regulator
MPKAKKKENDTNTENALQFLLAKWAHFSPVQRGKRLAELVDRGYSRRELGLALNVSEGTVRYCLKRVKLAQNSRKGPSIGDDRSAFRKNHSAIEHPEPLKIVGEPAGSFQDAGQEENRRTTIDGAQQQQPESPLEPPGPAAAATTTIPALNAESGGRLIADQVRSEFSCGYRCQFIEELKTAPDTLRKAEFRAQALSPEKSSPRKTRQWWFELAVRSSQT